MCVCLFTLLTIYDIILTQQKSPIDKGGFGLKKKEESHITNFQRIFPI